MLWSLYAVILELRKKAVREKVIVLSVGQI